MAPTAGLALLRCRALASGDPTLQYERFVLIYDSESGQLGSAALSLLESGIDVLYAADLDEALLLAGQESERLGALLAPSMLDPAVLEALLERVCPFLSGGNETLVPIGLEPDPAVTSQLRKAGVRWCLWEPYEPRELRFVASAAMMAGNPTERRKTLRVPAEFLAGLVQGSDNRQGVVCDLSHRGAYLGVEPPFPPGSEVQVELPIPAGSIFLRARVAHAHGASAPPRHDLPGGVGLEFIDPGVEDRQSVSRLLESLTGNFRL